jgi:hypothetical protein
MRDANATTTAVLRFDGRLVPASFAAFAAHRAARLSLDHAVLDRTTAGATIRVSGPAALVDAFELARSLGPADCQIRDVTRLPDPEPSERGA